MLPRRYLGSPLFLGSPRKVHFEPLLATNQKKLSGWWGKSLPFAGRLVLTKHALASIPLHISLVLPLPKSTCAAIERLMRNFLWSASSSKEKANFASWRKVCPPFSEGGLSICHICEVNKACAIRLGWRASLAPPYGQPGLKRSLILLAGERFVSHFLKVAWASVASERLIRLVPFNWVGVPSLAPPYGQLGLGLSTLSEASFFHCNLCMEDPASGNILGTSAIPLQRTVDGSSATVALLTFGMISGSRTSLCTHCFLIWGPRRMLRSAS